MITQSSMTPLVLGPVWLVTGCRNTKVAGAATGVLLHFLRAIATGPGLPSAWPASRTHFRLQYRTYLGALAILAIMATARAIVQAPRA